MDTTKEFQRKAFLAKLDENEDDEDTRKVYSDWLEEHGEDDEAKRQREWTAAKAWLKDFCRPEYDHYEDHPVKYEELMSMAQEAYDDWASGVEGDVGFGLGRREDMCDALRSQSVEFWKHWSIVTGKTVPAEVAEQAWYSCGC